MSGRTRSKAILKLAAVSVIAAIFCTGCGDKDKGIVSGACGSAEHPYIDTAYVITFDANGGDVSPASGLAKTPNASCDPRGILAYIPTPTRDGYTFRGWWKEGAAEEDHAVVAGTAYAIFQKDSKIYAWWTLNVYRITFDAHGGAVTPEYDSTGGDGKLASLPEPTRDDHVFVGWYKDVVGEREKVEDTTTYNENTTLYAHWIYSREHFKITFDANYEGGTVDPVSEETDAGGKLEELPWLERDGYAFVGWFTAAEGGNAVTTDYPFGAAATIYARWKEITDNMYRVTFNAHGGLVSPAYGMTDEDGRLLAALPVPKREGFMFMGWFTEDATITAGTVFKAPTTVNAVWTIIHYTITLDPTGGELESTALTTHSHWELLVDLPVPTRVGYTFTGWYTELTGGIHVTPATPLIGNRSIYAHWVENPPSLVDDRDGKAYKEVAIGEQIWMAENLNFATSGSVCYNNDPARCDMYGRLYTWEDAKTACPVGWRLPTDGDWTELMDFITGLSSFGTAQILKSKTGWYCDYSLPCGTDNYGFSALPAPTASADGVFSSAYCAYWWSATERDGKPEEAWTREILDGELLPAMVHKYGRDKRDYLPVRCLKD